MPLRAVRFLAAALLVVTASAAELTVESGGSINLMGCGSGGVGAAGLSTALDATAEHIIASLSPPTPPASAAPSLAEAATATHDFTDHDGVEFTVYEFQVGAHQFQVPAPMEVDVLIVAGGGGTAATTGGGGGAGGVVHLEGKALDAKKTYTVKVGAGGNGGGTLSKNNMNGKDRKHRRLHGRVRRRAGASAKVESARSAQDALRAAADALPPEKSRLPSVSHCQSH